MCEYEYGLRGGRYALVRMRVCVCVCASLPASVCVLSLCLFSAQQNLINSAGMEIISARRAQETERDGGRCLDGWGRRGHNESSNFPIFL